MNAVEKLQAAIKWIQSRDKLRVYRAPETLTRAEKWSIGVWSANLAILQSALGDSGGSHDEPNAFRLAVDLADAILGGDS